MRIELPLKVKLIIEKLQLAGYEAYAVGGCVRDSLLNRSPKDWDITTSANPYQVKELFDRTIDTGIQHGTVTVMFGKEGFEVTTYRVDGEYEDNRHPKQVTFTNQLLEDLRRRDFTINAMAYSSRDGLIDAFSGLLDLEEKIVRCVGSARERFDEDALRILRAIRFSAQLNFSIEADTFAAIKEKAGKLQNISAERIREELNKLLLSDYPRRLIIAFDSGITKVVLPEFDQMILTEQENHHHIYSVGIHCLEALSYFVDQYPLEVDNRDEIFTKKEQLVIRWTLLLHDVGKPKTKTIGKDGEGHFYGHAALGASMAKEILKRLRFDNETIDLVYKLIYYHDYRYQADATHMRKAMNKIGAENMELLFTVQMADVMAQNPSYQKEKLEKLELAKKLYDQIIDQKDCVSLKTLAVNGKDLIQAGFRPGKEIGVTLNALLNLVLEHPEYNTKEQLLSRLP